MSYSLNYSPGQLVTIFWETLDDTGARADGYDLPSVQRIILPNNSLASGYPQDFTKIDRGLYKIQFLLPNGAAAVGSYLVDIAAFDPSTGLLENGFVIINCQAAYGRYSATVG